MKTRRSLLVGTVATATLALTLSAVSCSSVKTQAPQGVAEVIHVKEGDRVPASEPRVYWTHAEKKFLVGQNGIHEEFSAEIQQVKEWTESVPYQDTCYRDGYIEEPGYCESYHCSQAGNGTGKSEAWDAFYAAPKSRKAAALADAIKGVGMVSATKLLAADYFRQKPHSWEDFSNEIERAVRHDVIGKDISYQILVKYKSENVTNLGYDVASCTTYRYSCTIYTPGAVPYSCTKYKEKTYSRVIDTVKRNVVFDVVNPALQSFETDNASVSVGRDFNDVEVEIGPYNRYNVSVDSGLFGTSRVRATAVQRILVDLPRSVVRSATLQKRDAQAEFHLRVNSQYVGEGRDQLVLKYNVHSCKMNFFSLCLGSYQAGEDVIVPITQSETSIGIPLQKKTKSKVVFTLARKGSRFYNDNYISAFETDSVSQK